MDTTIESNGYAVRQDTHQGNCLECGDRIAYGRPDKKFCCESCKNKYNNRRAKSSRILKLRILNALEKNHRILSQLLKMEIKSIDISNLRQLGFDFEHITSYHKVRGHAEIWCFDIKMLVTETRVKSITRVSPVVLSEE